MWLEIIRKVGCWVAICLFLTFMVRSSCFGKVIWTTPKFRTFARTSIKVWSFSCIDVVLTTTESCRQATAFFIRSMRWMNEVFTASPNRVFTGSGLFAAFILWAASPRNTVRTATVFLNQWKKSLKKGSTLGLETYGCCAINKGWSVIVRTAFKIGSTCCIF